MIIYGIIFYSSDFYYFTTSTMKIQLLGDGWCDNRDVMSNSRTPELLTQMWSAVTINPKKPHDTHLEQIHVVH